jgi:hypothetical protein
MSASVMRFTGIRRRAQANGDRLCRARAAAAKSGARWSAEGAARSALGAPHARAAGSRRWSAAERAALAEIARAKGGRRESDFVRRFDEHAKLRRAIAALAAEEPLTR